jgi:Polyketide cyclase / dehydrase and lipid transport
VTRVETSVRIRRPIGDVFDFVADPLNFRHWNSAVTAVWSTHERERVVGSTYRMERDLPSGRVRNDIKISSFTPFAPALATRAISSQAKRTTPRALLALPFLSLTCSTSPESAREASSGW